MALVEVPGILKAVKRWDTIELDWDKNEVTINGETTLPCIPIPQRTKDIVECGSLINYIREKRFDDPLVRPVKYETDNKKGRTK